MIGNNPGLYFPEVIPVAIIVIGSPVWLLTLLLESRFAAAAILCATMVLSVFAFLWAAMVNSRFGVYAAMLIILAGAWVTSSA